MLLFQPGAEKITAQPLRETPFGDSLLHPLVTPPVPNTARQRHTPLSRLLPPVELTPCSSPEGRRSALPHAAPQGRAPRPLPHIESGQRPGQPQRRSQTPSGLTRPRQPPARPRAGAVSRPEDRARHCGVSHLCEEPGSAGLGSGAGAGRPRRGWQRCSQRPSWPPQPSASAAHCHFRPGPRAILGTVVRTERQRSAGVGGAAPPCGWEEPSALAATSALRRREVLRAVTGGESTLTIN